MNDDRLIGTRALARLLQVDRYTVYRMLKAGRLPVPAVRGKNPGYLWRLSDVERWVESLPT